MKKLLLLFIVATIAVACSTTPSKPDELTNEVYIIAKDFAKQRLKAPSTAEFQSSYEVQPVNEGGGQYSISFYVDSQNGFGAMIRTNIIMKLKLTGGDWADINNWELISFDSN
jgi:hypothetical protein